jgi:hypothetical protein
MNSIITKIAGVSFGSCQRNIKYLGNPGINTFDLKREPMNPHDPNAVWVGFGKYQLGYLPKHVAKTIAVFMDAGKKIIAEFVSVNRSPFHDTVGMTVKLIEINN